VIAGLYGGEIDALHGESNVANAVAVLTSALGLIVVGSLVLSSVLTFRATRNESEIRETIAELKREGVSLDRLLKDEYEVSVPEAIERLERLKYALIGVIRYLSTRIPPGFEDDGTARPISRLDQSGA
jgi:hypothetical protein